MEDHHVSVLTDGSQFGETAVNIMHKQQHIESRLKSLFKKEKTRQVNTKKEYQRSLIIRQQQKSIHIIETENNEKKEQE